MLQPRQILIKFTAVLFFISGSIRSQDPFLSAPNLGFSVGLNAAFGTHFQRLGLNLNLYYVADFFQANSEIRIYYNFKNLGPKFIYPELVLSQGLLLGYGKDKQFANPFISSVSNQTRYANSVAYSYNAYFNKRQTTQQSGIISFQIREFNLIAENDILAKPTLDRFRTGAFLLNYQFEDKFQAGINCTMWTGKLGNRASIERKGFYSKCYMDTTGSLYANYSHGLLSAQFKYYAGYAQSVQGNLGIDAEQVRNAVQNKFIHNMRFIPKKWHKAINCHIPMLDRVGQQYLYKEGQKIKPATLYMNVFSNANLFY